LGFLLIYLNWTFLRLRCCREKSPHSVAWAKVWHYWHGQIVDRIWSSEIISAVTLWSKGQNNETNFAKQRNRTALSIRIVAHFFSYIMPQFVPYHIMAHFRPLNIHFIPNWGFNLHLNCQYVWLMVYGFSLSKLDTYALNI
jgi:hypothetical protein